ncbi:MAG: aminopeptidase P family protein [Candidatus Tectomicrobia bacterium]|nr:aminopeptidase P family protein [Candidatus Tectomicrobia bacterium]
MYPFNKEKLQELMEQAQIDLLLASTRHNIRYLAGGYYYHFHARFTQMGRSQYLPFIGIPRGHFDDAFYVGLKGEERGEELEVTEKKLWLNRYHYIEGRGTIPAAEKAAEAITELDLNRAKIAIELPFLPADAYETLKKHLSGASFVDATPLLDELRAIKTPEELDLIHSVADRVSESIQATFATGYDGVTTLEMANRVEQEMTQRGLHFLWVFTCAGPSYLRAPSTQTWQRGRILHIDSGGSVNDYLADLCRMGSLGEPSLLARDLHSACLDVQSHVRNMLQPGVKGSEVYEAGQEALKRHPLGKYGVFVAHGIGMVSHEQPVINSQIHRSLEAGMVLSIETEFRHPDIGHVKIEDAIAVTPHGNEGLGDLGREWQIIGK